MEWAKICNVSPAAGINIAAISEEKPEQLRAVKNKQVFQAIKSINSKQKWLNSNSEDCCARCSHRWVMTSKFTLNNTQ